MNPTTAIASEIPRKSLRAGQALLVVLGLMTLFVMFTRELSLLDPNSFLRQRYSAISWLMLAHGVPGGVALVLGFFQFSNRLRARYLAVHRLMGRIYVVSVAISAPTAVAVAIALPTMTLTPAAIIQSFGWLAATATGLYCIRRGDVQQHREWMLRGYPFAMVFVVVRVILAIPAVERMGELGVASVVWPVLAMACFLPSFVIAWQKLPVPRRREILQTAPTVG